MFLGKKSRRDSRLGCPGLGEARPVMTTTDVVKFLL
jgi:hypothetical protein